MKEETLMNPSDKNDNNIDVQGWLRILRQQLIVMCSHNRDGRFLIRNPLYATEEYKFCNIIVNAPFKYALDAGFAATNKIISALHNNESDNVKRLAWKNLQRRLNNLKAQMVYL